MARIGNPDALMANLTAAVAATLAEQGATQPETVDVDGPLGAMTLWVDPGAADSA